jgi:hypothetical protein
MKKQYWETYHPYERVLYKDEIFTVVRKRVGVDLYEICKVDEWYGVPYESSPKSISNIIDGIRAEELELCEDYQKTAAQDGSI